MSADTPEEFDEDLDAADIERARQDAIEEENDTPVIDTPVVESKGFDEIDIDDAILEAALIEEEKIPEVIKADIPNLSDLISYTTGDVKELEQALVKELNITEDDLADIMQDATNPVTKLARLIIEYTKQAEYQNRQLEKHKDDLVLASDLIPDMISYGKSFDNEKNKILRGDAAKLNMVARLHGLKKTYLPYSGFFVVIKKLSLTEIREILKYIDEEERTLGQILGGHYYTVDDILMVQKFCDFLPSIIFDSNLKDWKQKDVLLQSISILDFDTIVHAVETMMFKEGIKHEVICPILSCKYSEVINMDIEKVKRIDSKRLSEKALQRLLSPTEFTYLKYKAYQKEIGAIKEIDVKPGVKLTLKVPTIFTFIKYGTDYIAKLIEALYSDDRTPTQQDIIEYRVINYYKQFLSWISKVTFYKEDGTVDWATPEMDAILEILEKDVWENSKNIEQLISFFSEVLIVHYAFLGEQCPECKQTPNPKTNGLIPIDIRSFFFNLSVYLIRKELQPY